MKIEVKHIHNIHHAVLEIVNNKVNFVVGPSGSGKSSISKAILADEGNLGNIKSLYGGEPFIALDGMTNFDKSQISLFSDNYRSECLITRTANNNIYEVFVGDKSDYLNYLNKLNILLTSFDLYKQRIIEFFSKMEQLKKEIFSYPKKKGSRKTNLEKFEESIREIPDSSRAKLRLSHQERLQWIKEGISLIDLGHNPSCPFCNKKLGSRLVDFIKTVEKIDPKSLDKLKQSEGLLSSLGIVDINFYNLNDLNKLKSKIIELISIEDNLYETLHKIDIIRFADINEIVKVDHFKVAKLTILMFPELEAEINNINLQIINLKSAYGIFIKHSKSKIQRSELKLNNYLIRFGIPYKFKLMQIDNGAANANYHLIHTSDSENKERTHGLSSGEQNIVALLLFLIGNKNKTIIIDDPASSFDENRRILIYQAILDLFENRTTLVFSHDFVFAKFASLDIYKGTHVKHLGVVKYFENNDYNHQVTFKDIDYSHFKLLEEHIQNHLSKPTTSYMSKVIALRLFYETKKRQIIGKIIYEYLSAILHQETNQVELINLLSSKYQFTEQQVLMEISKDFPNLYLEPYTGQIFTEETNLTIFERLIYKRELLRRSGSGKKFIKDQISNILHLNEAQVLQIDPYQFDCFPKGLIDFVKESL